jgi:hypothetical protein
MAKSKAPVRTSISVDPAVLAWARQYAAENPDVRSVSHLVEVALREFRARRNLES